MSGGFRSRSKSGDKSPEGKPQDPGNPVERKAVVAARTSSNMLDVTATAEVDRLMLLVSVPASARKAV